MHRLGWLLLSGDLDRLLVIAINLAIMFDALSVLARYGSFLGDVVARWRRPNGEGDRRLRGGLPPFFADLAALAVVVLMAAITVFR